MNKIEDRRYWLETLLKIAHPVLHHASQRNLKKNMPQQRSDQSEETKNHIEDIGKAPRGSCGPIEAVARLLSGIAPWLEHIPADEEEELLRRKYANLAREAIDAVTDPESPDYWNLGANGVPYAQELVESAYLSLAIVRAPEELWGKLDKRVRENLLNALRSTRKIRPPRNNWLLFSAMNEAALRIMGETCDTMRLDYAIAQYQNWYHGGGSYGDGPDYAWDYYNSYVIHPMLIEIMETVKDLFSERSWLKSYYFPYSPSKTHGEQMLDFVYDNARKYSCVLERMIAPDGTFPALGRSIVYRTGAFQPLAQLALRHRLDPSLSPSQVRCALTAVIKRCLGAKGTFDDAGWLTLGLHGCQPQLAEDYISRGSVYLCTNIFLPLGLPEDDAFWTEEASPWSSVKLWGNP